MVTGVCLWRRASARGQSRSSDPGSVLSAPRNGSMGLTVAPSAIPRSPRGEFVHRALGQRLEHGPRSSVRPALLRIMPGALGCPTAASPRTQSRCLLCELL